MAAASMLPTTVTLLSPNFWAFSSMVAQSRGLCSTAMMVPSAATRAASTAMEAAPTVRMMSRSSA